MAIKVRFYNFTKRPNSTKLVGTLTYKEYDCTLKQSCSLLYPVLNLNIAAGDITKYNYVYIASFQRYYFIDDIVYNAGIFTWDIYLHVDVLATYKYDIGKSTQYIARSLSLPNGDVIDSLYPIRGEEGNSVANWKYKTIEYGYDTVKAYPIDGSESTVSYFNVGFTSGKFVVGITGNNNSGVTYYAMSYSRFKAFIKNCFEYNPSSSDMSSLDSGLSNAIWSPIDFITYCRWFPDVTTASGSTASSAYVGRYSINFGGSVDVLSTRNVTEYYLTLSIPDHPKATVDTTYLNLSPYRELSLYMPSFGMIPIDSEKIYGSSSLVVKWFTDYMTGNAIIQLVREHIGDPDTIMYVGSGEIGVPISISALQYGLEGAATSFAYDYLKQTYTSGMSYQQAVKDSGGGKIAQAVGWMADTVKGTIQSAASSGNVSAVGNIIDATMASQGQLKTSGNGGSFMTYNMDRPTLHVWVKYTTTPDPDRFGYPSYMTQQLDQLSGFFSCLNANISSWPQGRPTSPEYEAIIGYLNSGAFWE